LSVACASTRAFNAATSRWPPSPNHNRYCSQASRTSSSTSRIRRPRMAAGSALQRDEGVAAGVLGIAPQRLLDAQQLVVLGHAVAAAQRAGLEDRKSTRLNSSHVKISYAVFCLKK